MKFDPPFWLTAVLAVVLPSCSPSVSVRPVTPPPPSAEAAIVHPGSAATTSLAAALETARTAEARLLSGDRTPGTIAAYNYAVARAIESLENAKLDPWGDGFTIPTNSGPIHLKGRFALKERAFSPRDYRMIPTDTFAVGGTYFTHLDRQSGIGAPLAVVRDHGKGPSLADLSESMVYGTVTATISFRGNDAELMAHESLRVDEVNLRGRTFPLAADYSTPLALMIKNSKVESLGLKRMIIPDRYAFTARMTRLQLYDPERIPVVFVHGLDSTPATWTPMINAIRNDPELRKKYQIWVFSYPSGYPYPYAAALLRDELDRMNRIAPGHKPIVLVGHSMGGIISRLMLTDSDDTIWRAYFGKSPARTHIPGLHRKELEKALIFDHRKEIGRTIFISSPHRGSEIAISSFGRLMSRLIRPPRLFANLRDSIISVVTIDATALTLERAPSGIDTLAPNNRFVRTINRIPIVSGSKFHSIMGDRGKGNTPDSSDGVVPYWSSHLDGALSEKIVPSGHSAHANPEGIEEVLRILRLHLR